MATEYDASPNDLAIFDAYGASTPSGRVSISEPNSKAFYVGSRITDTSGFMLLFNSSTTPTVSASNTSTITPITKPNYEMFFGAVNNGGTPFYQPTSNRKFGFLSFGDGLTSGECVTLYSAVKQLQYDLGRNQSVFV